MFLGERARVAAGRPGVTVTAAVAVLCAGLLGLHVDRSSATSGGDAWGMAADTLGAPPPTVPSSSLAPGPPEGVPREQPRVLGEADGVVSAGVTVFDDDHPAVANLDPALLRALRHAATDAARQRVTLDVNSGWRSPRYQEQLLREAIAEYGSEAEAARWVATPDTSAHVSGDAVDIGPSTGMAWLSRHGADYGLCQIYRNEPWHYEFRAEARDHGCPAVYADAAHDPRMQR